MHTRLPCIIQYIIHWSIGGFWDTFFVFFGADKIQFKISTIAYRKQKRKNIIGDGRLKKTMSQEKYGVLSWTMVHELVLHFPNPPSKSYNFTNGALAIYVNYVYWLARTCFDTHAIFECVIERTHKPVNSCQPPSQPYYNYKSTNLLYAEIIKHHTFLLTLSR